MRRRAGQILLCLGFVVLGMQCDDPFFPKTDEPDHSIPLRHTPAGVIDQLIKSYETKNITLFRDLFSAAGTYRFYISKSYVAEYTANHNAALSEEIDSPLVADILPGLAYYWTYADEISKHEKMFTEVDDIQFTALPIIPANGINYIVSANNETTYATVILRDGEFTVTASQLFSDPIDVDIEEQVFYLARDPADATLWVIDKWFDLGIQQ